MRAPTMLRASTRLPLPRLPRRPFSLSPASLSSNTTAAKPSSPPADGGGSGAKGRTGGGAPLGSSSPNAPPRPKVFSSNVPGPGPARGLTAEQKDEVDEHNRHFAKKHDRSQRAPGDKVDDRFWNNDSKG
ncbi:Uncharacterized protein TPAR_03528 [Tolypocladium paradoxum]|uniref:Succinate dehydrogenase assembly factor 4, mitochondrial n=1 Tax=Tolypocladium paradoxum TaxID=94208 RepID=A0A2S4L1E8_9HYPO|nr:Uncharacterized protein TPAR_03528 [Tolypocladium paradoxum]